MRKENPTFFKASCKLSGLSTKKFIYFKMKENKNLIFIFIYYENLK